IGSVSATSGSGATPFTFPGKVYYMGPTKGAPYGMAFIIPTAAGPFNLGNAVAFATINVNQENARVIVSSELPTIVAGGVPVRLRRLSVSVNRQGFLLNPTNCGVLATDSSVTGLNGLTLGSPGATLGSPVLLSTPFQVSGCDKLPFKPKFTAATTSK